MAEVSSSTRSVDAKDVFRSAITSVLRDDGLTVPTEGVKLCLKAANDFNDVFKEPSRECILFANKLVDQIKSLIDKRKAVNKEKILTDFHKLRCSQCFENGWKSFLDTVKIQCNPLFYQHFTQEVFEKLLKLKLNPASESFCEEEVYTARLTSDEENAVRFVSGYVLRKIQDALKLPDDQLVLDVLTQLLIKSHAPVASDPSCGSSEQWTNRIDRGGLTHVTDQAFECFYAIEYCIRRHLRLDKVGEMDTTFRTRLEEAIISDDDVQFSWCLTGPMDDDAGRKCLQLIIKKWVTIRGFSFANSIVELYKQDSKKGTGKSKGLRSSLFT